MGAKRVRAEEDIEMDVESLETADFLLLLSRGKGEGQEVSQEEVPAGRLPLDRVFECKTCSRKFASFQALGGHRASHRKPRLPGDLEPGAGGCAAAKPKAHECPICGLEFAIGQALGGHMRRHRNALAAPKKVENKKVFYFDLNLPALEEEEEERQPELAFGLGIVRQIPIVH